MDEQVLEDCLLDRIDEKTFVETLFKKSNYKEGDFLLTRQHLLKLCDLTLDEKIEVGLLENISDWLIFSDYFNWDGKSKDGEIISETIFEWANPDNKLAKLNPSLERTLKKPTYAYPDLSGPCYNGDVMTLKESLASVYISIARKSSDAKH